MPSGVGMADIVFGKALRNGLVRQIVVRVRHHNDAEDLLRTAYLKLACHQIQTPIDDATASRVCTATYVYAGNQQHSRVLKKRSSNSAT